MDRNKLKRIRWFSNGIWKFQPHLHFMQNMAGDVFAEKVEKMEHGGVININENFFKMEPENVGTV